MSQNHTNPNRQRDHQANERTFLAWLRTSLALIGFGFAIARFGLFTRQIGYALSKQTPEVHPLSSSENFGLSLVMSGILTVLLATWHFNEVFQQIERRDFRPRRLLMWFMTGLMLAIGGISIPLVLWHGEQPTTERSKQHQSLPRSL
jgi:putative membrane protein